MKAYNWNTNAIKKKDIYKHTASVALENCMFCCIFAYCIWQDVSRVFFLNMYGNRRERYKIDTIIESRFIYNNCNQIGIMILCCIWFSFDTKKKRIKFVSRAFDYFKKKILVNYWKHHIKIMFILHTSNRYKKIFYCDYDTKEKFPIIFSFVIFASPL